MSKHILVVEDDLELASSIAEYLSEVGYRVTTVADGNSAVQKIRADSPDLVILDVMLPGRDGISVCREVRADYSGFILMFTAREDELDQILGLELGADDYLFKPVKPRLLLAKVNAFLRRAQMPSDDFFAIGQLRLDKLNEKAWLDGVDIGVSPMEYQLLFELAENAGQVLSRESLVERMSQHGKETLERGLDYKVCQLRRKLGDDGRTHAKIKTVRGRGYVLIADAF